MLSARVCGYFSISVNSLKSIFPRSFLPPFSSQSDGLLTEELRKANGLSQINELRTKPTLTKKRTTSTMTVTKEDKGDEPDIVVNAEPDANMVTAVGVDGNTWTGQQTRSMRRWGGQITAGRPTMAMFLFFAGNSAVPFVSFLLGLLRGATRI